MIAKKEIIKDIVMKMFMLLPLFNIIYTQDVYKDLDYFFN